MNSIGFSEFCVFVMDICDFLVQFLVEVEFFFNVWCLFCVIE